jgi:hypothetical protein
MLGDLGRSGACLLQAGCAPTQSGADFRGAPASYLFCAEIVANYGAVLHHEFNGFEHADVR